MTPELICCKCHRELVPDKYFNLTASSPDPELVNLIPSTIKLCSRCLGEVSEFIFFGYVDEPSEF